MNYSMARKAETYENMMGKLDEIVDTLEDNTLSLEKSMEVYEEGIKLINKLYKTLSTIEGKVKVIEESFEDSIKE